MLKLPNPIHGFENLEFNPGDLLIDLSEKVGTPLGSDADPVAEGFLQELSKNHYGKLPEIISTKDRLKELPPHSMVLGASPKPEHDPGDPIVRLTEKDGVRGWWNQKTHRHLSVDQIPLPVTVVFIPTKFRKGAVAESK